MSEIGVMLAGYFEYEAEFIQYSLKEIIGKDLLLFSGKSEDERIIMQILEDGEAISGSFPTVDRVIEPWLMFLGFSDEDINLVIKNFPIMENMPRPIFCGLTEENSNWTIPALSEHLAAERAYWQNKER